MRELADIIAHINDSGRPKKVEIRTDRLETVTEPIIRSGVTLIDRKPSEPVTAATFMGVTIVADPKMPPGFAAVIADGEIVNILDLRSKEEEPRE